MMPNDPAARSHAAARRAVVAAAAVAGLFLVLATLDGDLGPAHAILAVAAVAGVAALSRRGVPGGQAVEPRGPAALPTSPVAFLPDPAVVVDARAVVTDLNAAAARILPGLRVGAPLSFALRDPGVLEAIGPVARLGGDAAVEYRGRVAADPTFEVRLRRLPDGGTEQAPGPLVALFFRDLTDQRRTETMRVDFIANVSHELRTPLASLIGFIETLQGPARADAAARERFLVVMHEQAIRMRRLIDDLLQLSRVEMRAHVPPAKRLDLNDVVGHMVEVMTPLARERGATLALDLPGEPSCVLGERDELLRVVENLVENAIRYGGGRVEIAVRSGDGRVELTVRDHGPGIPSEHLPRLTERFYRVDVSHSRAEGGTGLGLAIVKHIATHHRGRLAIESAPGTGALFRVSLPAAPTE